MIKEAILFSIAFGIGIAVLDYMIGSIFEDSVMKIFYASFSVLWFAAFYEWRKR